MLYRSFIVLLLFCSACSYRSTSTQVRFYDDGRAKPICALFPVIDSSDNNLSWNLSEELTFSLCHRIVSKDKLFLLDRYDLYKGLSKLINNFNPFVDNPNLLKACHKNEEYILFVNILSYGEVQREKRLINNKSENGPLLSIRFAVKVFDMRNDVVEVVLSEVIEHTHRMPKQFASGNYVQAAWNEPGFPTSFIGYVHADIVKEIVSRFEEYILLAQSR